VAVLSTTLDDMLPEFFGHLMTQLFAAGALDVQYTPVQMKKARPATLVTVIARPEDGERLATLILKRKLDARGSDRTGGAVGARAAHRRGADALRPGSGQDRDASGWRRARRSRIRKRPRLAESCRVPIDEIYRAALQAASESHGA
jgi:hypothetical protein